MNIFLSLYIFLIYLLTFPSNETIPTLFSLFILLHESETENISLLFVLFHDFICLFTFL